MEHERDGYEISTDPDRLDVDAIHRFLSEEAYWSPADVPRERVDRAIAGSLCFGIYAPDGSQAAFGRAVTDYASFAFVADVFVLGPHRGRGLGVWLIEAMVGHPDLAPVRRFVLATADAHGLYRRFGFAALPDPERYMALLR